MRYQHMYECVKSNNIFISIR